MLNQSSHRRIDQTSQWCVGNPPPRWDISFSAKVAEKFKHWFGRRDSRLAGRDRPIPIKSKPARNAA